MQKISQIKKINIARLWQGVKAAHGLEYIVHGIHEYMMWQIERERQWSYNRINGMIFNAAVTLHIHSLMCYQRKEKESKSFFFSICMDLCA